VPAIRAGMCTGLLHGVLQAACHAYFLGRTDVIISLFNMSLFLFMQDSVLGTASTLALLMVIKMASVSLSRGSESLKEQEYFMASKAMHLAANATDALPTALVFYKNPTGMASHYVTKKAVEKGMEKLGLAPDTPNRMESRSARR